MLKVVSFIFGFFMCACNRQSDVINIADKDLPVIDLNSYLGKWYEIASIPFFAQKNCECTYAQYQMLPDKKTISVYNFCIDKESGKEKSISGKAFQKKNGVSAHLKVQFFWPFKADYIIFYVDSDYQHAIVGNRNGKYLWLLAREAVINQEKQKMLLQKAVSLGFDTKKLVFTKQCFPSKIERGQ